MQTTVVRGSGTKVRIDLPKSNSKVTILVDGKLKQVPLSAVTKINFAA